MSEASAVPKLDTATDPIYCAADLRERWRALMGPLGFGERLLWFGFVGPDRRMHKVLSQVAIGRTPHRKLVADVMVGLSVLLEDFEPGSSVTLLLTRPGHDPASEDDRRWAAVLTDAAAGIGVPLEPIFRANNAAIVEL